MRMLTPSHSIRNPPQSHPSAGEYSPPPVGGYLMRQETIWLRSARDTASVRLATPNLDRILLTWDLTVEELTVSRPAICVLFNPSTIKARTSSSRSVRSRPGAGG